jgi:hypothetical protein
MIVLGRRVLAAGYHQVPAWQYKSNIQLNICMYVPTRLLQHQEPYPTQPPTLMICRFDLTYTALGSRPVLFIILELAPPMDGDNAGGYPSPPEGSTPTVNGGNNV